MLLKILILKKGSDADGGAATITELMKTKVNFHKPGENYKTDGYVITDRTMDLLKAHLKLTGGQVKCLLEVILRDGINFHLVLGSNAIPT